MECGDAQVRKQNIWRQCALIQILVTYASPAAFYLLAP